MSNDNHPILPEPIDDGACNHLLGQYLPSVTLMSTSNRLVDLGRITGKCVVYCYPLTAQPDMKLPQGWDGIPGASGCTPQARGFRDHYQELKSLGVQVFGMSTQDTSYQQEVVERLLLPFELLSDSSLEFTTEMRLPTFSIENMTFIKRLTIITYNGKVEKVFYPVFPPNKNAEDVTNWFSENFSQPTTC